MRDVAEEAAAYTSYRKHVSVADRLQQVRVSLAELDVNLTLLTDVDGKPKVAQFVSYNMQDIHVHGDWEAPTRRRLIPIADCRAADFRPGCVTSGRHQIVDIVLQYGRVLHG